MNKENIEKIRTILKSVQESEETTKLLLSMIKDCIEKLDIEEQQKFVMLWFVSDWSVQQNIGKSIPALMLLKKANKRLEELKDVESDVLFIRQLKDTISFEVLRVEMQEFLKKYGLPADIVMFPYHFKRFQNFLVHILLNNPMSFPDPQNKGLQKILSKIVQKQVKKRTGIISFNMSYVDRGIAEGGSKPTGISVAALIMLTHDNMKIVIPL